MSTSSVIRVLSATALAAVAAAALAGVWALSFSTVPVAFIVALPHALVGSGIFFALRSHGYVGLRSSLVGGFLVGAVPFGLFAFFLGPDSASVGGIPAVVEGEFTLRGWLQYLFVVATLGFHGAIAGFVFLLVTRPVVNAIAVGESDAPHSPRARVGHSTMLLVVATVLVIGIFSIPSITRDRTCHNSLRDGRTSIGSEANINVGIGISEWHDLTAILEDFGRSTRWSVRKEIRNEPGIVDRLYVSVCSEGGTNFSVNEIMFSNSPLGRFRDGSVGISVYQPQGGDTWKAPANELVARLSSQWPGRVWFTGRMGEEISSPEWLKPAFVERTPRRQAP